MLKVVRILTRMNIGGPARSALALSQALMDRGDVTRILTGEPGPHEGDVGLEGHPDIEIQPIPGLGRSLHWRRDWQAYRALKRELLRDPPDIVHTHAAKAGALGRLAATSIRPRPLIVHSYHGHVLSGNFGPLKSTAYTWIERRLARGTDQFITVADRVRDELVDVFEIGSRDRFRVIPGGAEPLEGDALSRDEARKELGLEEGDTWVGVVARLAPVKGHDLLIQAMKALPVRSRPRIALLGDGPLRDVIRASIEKEGLTDSVRMLGWVRPPRRYVRAFDCVLLSSRQEGLPLALLEAMSEGVPVASTAVGGVEDLLEDGRNGFVISPGDPRALAEFLGRIATLGASLSAIAQAGQETARHFTMDRHVERVLSVYDDLVSRHPQKE